MNEESYFDGKLIEVIGLGIVSVLACIFTLFIAYPWVICMFCNWEAKHTVIEGKRLAFDGTPMSLFLKWLKWMFFTIITFGIYSFWISIELKKWKTEHTYFM